MTTDRADKRFILQTILDGVLKDSGTDFRVATLGGEGLEAALWEVAGIPHRHGWLIEASPDRGKKLIRKSDYMLLEGQLEKFPRMFDSQEGVDMGLRLFHWDLCGTVEPSIADLATVLPLLERSPVSTLVVTVADARGNTALAKPKDAEARIERLFRKNGKQIKSSLIELYGRSEDPRPTVTRELSTVGLIFEKLNKLEVVSMMRYFYLSMHIRMRTYVFHLKPRLKTTSLAEFRRQQLSAWLGSEVQWIKNGEANGIPPFVTEADKRKVKVMENESSKHSNTEIDQIKGRIAPFLGMISAETKADIERLLVLAATPKIDQEALIDSITQDVLTRVLGGLTTAFHKGKSAPIQPSKDAAVVVAPKNGNGLKNGNGKNGLQTRSQAAHKFSELDLAEKDVLRLDLIRAFTKGEKEFETQRDEIINKYGLNRAKTRIKQIGMMKGNGMGQHRPQFVARMLGRAQDEPAKAAMLANLVEAYGCSAEELEREAKKYNSTAAKAARSAVAKKAALH